MRRARDAGFRADVFSAVWHRGATVAGDLPRLRRAVDASTRQDVEPVLAVYQFSSSTPLDPGDRAAFAAYAAALVRALPAVRTVIVGNEPNNDLFWQPQFGADGGDAAANSYERLLAQTYDALKQVDGSLTVVGGSLEARGGDDPHSSRPTHSPTAFITDLGRAYRDSGRTKPLMDAFSIHPYGETSRVPPTLAHPHTTTIGIADYDKLVSLLGRAFDGTAQEGSTLPVVYGEYGVETDVPPSERAAYTGHEPALTVDAATQAAYYVEAVHLAACQPNVRMLFLFHVTDEADLAGLQSGLFYASGDPKPSLDPVRAALEDPRCEGETASRRR